MYHFQNLMLKMGLLSLLSVAPLAAQVANGVGFTVSFPFYVGSVKMPAGSYRVSQSALGAGVLLIQNKDGKPAAMINCMATQSLLPHQQSRVSFKKDGSTEYLDRVWIEGETSGVEVVPPKNEMKMIENASAVQHSPASGQ